MRQNQSAFKTKEFNQDEFKQILDRSKELIKRGYFTGINFLQSDTPLPRNLLLIHFLHDSEKHLSAVKSAISGEHSIIPRYTCYMLRPEYFAKPNFRNEYSRALFFDADFNEISIDEAIRNPHSSTVLNRELDLAVPIKNNANLGDIVKSLQEADRKGPEPWLDPVLIIKTKSPVSCLPDFVDKHFVSISKMQEEFYSIISDEQRLAALSRYLDKLCATTKIGSLNRSDIVVDTSQINKKFAEFMYDLQNQLQALE